MAQFSNHLKILPTKPTAKIQEAKLVERPRYVRRRIRKREVGVAQASRPHFITVQDFSRFSSFFFLRFSRFFAFFKFFFTLFKIFRVFQLLRVFQVSSRFSRFF